MGVYVLRMAPCWGTAALAPAYELQLLSKSIDDGMALLSDGSPIETPLKAGTTVPEAPRRDYLATFKTGTAPVVLHRAVCGVELKPGNSRKTVPTTRREYLRLV